MNEIIFPTENHEILDALSTPYEERNSLWTNHFYKILPAGKFYNYGMAQDRLGRNHVAICLGGSTEEELVPFDRFNAYAFDNQAGIIILLHGKDQAPQEILHFGCIWSFKEYGDLRSCSNILWDYEQALKINPYNPFQVESADTDKSILYGEPSEEIFPLYVRKLITNEIQKIIPLGVPSFTIVEQKQYTLRFRIMVQINENYTSDQKSEIETKITWFMPPYFPIYVE